jgi:hypothetical protein
VVFAQGKALFAMIEKTHANKKNSIPNTWNWLDRHARAAWLSTVVKNKHIPSLFRCSKYSYRKKRRKRHFFFNLGTTKNLAYILNWMLSAHPFRLGGAGAGAETTKSVIENSECVHCIIYTLVHYIFLIA